MPNKKGQVNSLAPAIITLVIASVFVILGLVVLQEMRNTDIVTQANSRIVVNESLARVNETGTVLSGASSPAANSFTIIRAINSTGGTTIPPTNYTVSSTGVLYFTNGNSLGVNNSRWNVTYSYLYGDEAYTASNETIVGLGSIADFWEIIILAVVITIVIGLLLAVFGGKRNR